MNCITFAWQEHENELRLFLNGQVKNPVLAEDLLQDVFVKALAQGSQFCELENARAWLFRVARNHMSDYFRTHKRHEDVQDDLPAPESMVDPVANLASCLPTAMKRLGKEDYEIIERCDLEGMTQGEYARLKGLALPAAKSRIQRARKRLKQQLHQACQVILDDQGNVCCFKSDC
jgi:RNA polymerase sigma-70 factor (ECF subfamily)